MLKGISTSRVMVFLITILLSTVAWFYVTAAESRVDAFPGKIPLTLKNVPDGLVAILDVESIKVRIRADQRSWSLLSIDSFVATVNLDNFGIGVHEVPIVVAVTIPNVQVVEKDPPTVRVRLEQSVTKDLPVRVVVQGQAAEGQAPGEPSVSPGRVLAVGPKSILETLTDAQAVVTLAGEESVVQRIVRLQALDRTGKSLESVRFEPATVGVTIPIVKAADAKTVGIRVVTAGSPPDGYYVQKITVVPPTVTITGGADIIAIDTEPIDLTTLTADQTVTVDLVLPAGASLVDGLSRATVGLSIAPVPTSKQVPLTFNFSEIDPSLKVTEFNPPSGKVLLIGPAITLSGVMSSSAMVSLAGRGEGTHLITITLDQILPPPGTVVSGSPTPTTILVTLAPK